MYQKHFDILYKLKLHQQLINEFRDDLQEVKITNAIEEYFGKTYIRVYIELIVKEDSSRYMEFRDKYSRTIFGWTRENYVSFYLPAFKRDREELENKEESLDYDWIVNILEFGSWGYDAPKFTIMPFRSLWDKKEEDKKRSKEYEEKRSKVLDSLESSVRLTKNQLVVIKDYSSFKLGRLNEIGGRNGSISSLDIVEVKKDLTNGAKEIRYSTIYDIYAVIDPFQLERKVDKNMLLAYIEKRESFEGLIYIRPDDLW